MTLADRLRQTREAKGLNLSQVAREIGVARTAYRLWEKGAALPAVEHLRALAMWCEAPLASLLREAGILTAEEESALLALAAEEHARRRDGGGLPPGPA